MAKVCGTSEEARQLRAITIQTRKAIQDDAVNVQKQAQKVGEILKDDRLDEIIEFGKRLQVDITKIMPDVDAVAARLEKYAEFLDQR